MSLKKKAKKDSFKEADRSYEEGNRFYNDFLEVEEFLDEQEVFVSGISGRPQSLMSYMTCIEFPRLEKAIAAVRDKYTLEQWQYFCSQWEYFSYLSPIPKLLAGTIRRWLSLPKKEE